MHARTHARTHAHAHACAHTRASAHTHARARAQVDVAGASSEVGQAVLAANSAFMFTNSGSSPIKVSGQKGYANTQLFKTKKMNFEQVGGGWMHLFSKKRCGCTLF